MEAMAKIKEDNMRFDKVAEVYSEDKAKLGGKAGRKKDRKKKVNLNDVGSLGWLTRAGMIGVFQDAGTVGTVIK